MSTARNQLPARLVRLMNDAPSVDVERRTIEAVVATRLLARDGGILLPAGIDTRAFAANPNVLAMHGYLEGSFPVAGRCIALSKNERGIVATTQFAQTRLGEEIGYLYGVNPAKEVYCRGWSFGWRSLETDWITVDDAQKLLGSDFDAATVPPEAERYGVWVCKRGEMNEYSAVPVGADRAALSRAHKDGVRAAGEMLAGLDLAEAHRLIAELRAFKTLSEAKLERLEQDIQALRRDGAAAAARGDSAEIANSLRQIAAGLKKHAATAAEGTK